MNMSRLRSTKVVKDAIPVGQRCRWKSRTMSTLALAKKTVAKLKVKKPEIGHISQVPESRWSARVVQSVQKQNFEYYAKQAVLKRGEGFKGFEFYEVGRIRQLTGFAVGRLEKMRMALEQNQKSSRGRKKHNVDKEEDLKDKRENSTKHPPTAQKQVTTNEEEAVVEVVGKEKNSIDYQRRVELKEGDQNQLEVDDEEYYQQIETEVYPGLGMRKLLKSNRLDEAIAILKQKEEEDDAIFEQWQKQQTKKKEEVKAGVSSATKKKVPIPLKFFKTKSLEESVSSRETLALKALGKLDKHHSQKRKGNPPEVDKKKRMYHEQQQQMTQIAVQVVQNRENRSSIDSSTFVAPQSTVYFPPAHPPFSPAVVSQTEITWAVDEPTAHTDENWDLGGDWCHHLAKSLPHCEITPVEENKPQVKRVPKALPIKKRYFDTTNGFNNIDCYPIFHGSNPNVPSNLGATGFPRRRDNFLKPVRPRNGVVGAAAPNYELIDLTQE